MSEIHGAVGSYVIDALDPEELEEFEQHLAECPTCSREVVEFCETAAELSLLAYSSGPDLAAPPPMLRSSILSAISETRVLPPEAPAPPVAELPARTAAVPSPPAPPAPTDELAERRRRRGARLLSFAVAAAMVIALALGGWVYTLTQQQQTQVADQALETQLFAAADVQIVAKPMTNGGQASFVVSKSLNRALFIGNDLPSPGAGNTYKMWTLNAAGTPAPDSLVSTGGDQKQWFEGPIADAAALAVSIEADPDTPTPTDIQVVGEI